MTKGLCSPLQQQQQQPAPGTSPSPGGSQLHDNNNDGQCHASFGGSSDFDLKPRQDQLLAPGSVCSSSAFHNLAPGATMPLCAQCALPIVDPFILRVHPDLEFHAACLKCAECGRPLDEHCTAFVREGKTFCREDYIRLFSRRCPRCHMQFHPSDMVMRARQLVFHMDCFSCVSCQQQLRPGEQFLLRQDELLFCRRPGCFMQYQQQQFHLHINGGSSMPPPPSTDFATLQPQAPPMSGGEAGTPPYELVALGNGGGGQQQQQQNNGTMDSNFGSSAFAHPSGTAPLPPPASSAPNCPSVLSQLASSGASPLSFSNPDESMTPSSTNASTPTATTNGGAQSAQFGSVNHAPPMVNFDGNGGMSCAAAAHFAGGGSNCSSSSSSVIVPKGKKSKKDKPAQRVRTVLNEGQLKILKQTYHSSPRPDTTLKEHLVEMTGLNARVIRVWFQNKRCKDKKRQIEQREKQQSQEKNYHIGMLQPILNFSRC